MTGGGSGTVILTPPAPGTPLVEVVRFYTETTRDALGASWDIELIPLAGKNPRVNGAGWQYLASSDPRAVLDQLKRLGGRADGIGALMCHYIAFDVDDRSAVPPGLASIFEMGLFSPTREGRGHHLFRVPDSMRFGGSKMRLDPAFGVTRKWGEIKGWNSQVRIWSPNSDGSHVALTPALVPLLPVVLTGLLLEPHAPGDMATDAELEDFLAEHVDESAPEWLANDVEKLAGDSRVSSKYEAMVRRSFHLASNVAAGKYGGRRAYGALLEAYRASCEVDEDWDSEREPKYREAWRGAVAKFTRDPDLIRAVEEKRRGTSLVSWDPEHDAGDAMLDDWFREWAPSLGAEYSGEVRDARGPALSTVTATLMMRAPSAVTEDDEADGSEASDAASQPGDGSAGVGAGADAGAASAETEPDDAASTEAEPDDDGDEPVSEPEGESESEPRRRPTLDDMREAWLGEADGRGLTWVKEKVREMVLLDHARENYRALQGGGDIEVEEIDLAAPDTEDDRPLVLGLSGRSDGMGLFYDDALTNLIADKASGKSWLCMWTALLELRRGRTVAWLDWEMTRRRTTQRLRQLGATPADVTGLRYLAMARGTLGDARKALMALPEGSLVFVDSVSRALASEAGASVDRGENDNTAYNAWVSRLGAIREARKLTVVLVEHTGHTSRHRARGASSKGQQADAEFSMQVVETWSRTTPGWAALTCRKDRGGWLVVDEPAYGAFFEPSASGDGSLTVDVRELNIWEIAAARIAAMDDADRAKAATRSAAEARSAGLEERVMDVMSDGVARSRAEITREIGEADKVMRTVYDALVADRRLTSIGTSSGRGSRLVRT